MPVSFSPPVIRSDLRLTCTLVRSANAIKGLHTPICIREVEKGVLIGTHQAWTVLSLSLSDSALVLVVCYDELSGVLRFDFVEDADPTSLCTRGSAIAILGYAILATRYCIIAFYEMHSAELRAHIGIRPLKEGY